MFPNEITLKNKKIFIIQKGFQSIPYVTLGIQDVDRSAKWILIWLSDIIDEFM